MNEVVSGAVVPDRGWVVFLLAVGAAVILGSVTYLLGQRIVRHRKAGMALDRWGPEKPERLLHAVQHLAAPTRSQITCTILLTLGILMATIGLIWSLYLTPITASVPNY